MYKNNRRPFLGLLEFLLSAHNLGAVKNSSYTQCYYAFILIVNGLVQWKLTASFSACVLIDAVAKWYCIEVSPLWKQSLFKATWKLWHVMLTNKFHFQHKIGLLIIHFFFISYYLPFTLIYIEDFFVHIVAASRLTNIRKKGFGMQKNWYCSIFDAVNMMPCIEEKNQAFTKIDSKQQNWCYIQWCSTKVLL